MNKDTFSSDKIQRGKARRQNSRSRGFILIEILLGVFILGLLFAARYINWGEDYINGQIAVEDRTLEEMAAGIRASLMSTDLTNVNIAAITGEIGPTDTATAFSTSTSPVYTTCAANDWFVKIANFRGVPVTLGIAPTPTVQPRLARILYNHFGQPRMLFIRPTVQSDKIELLLVSFMAPSSQMQMPTYQALDAWFDAIAAYNFDNRKLPIPAYWASQNLLSASQQIVWNNGTGGSNINRLRVIEIDIHKYPWNVSNNSSSYYGWVYWNNGGGRYVANPGSGSTSTPPIIEGRTVGCASGLVESSATLNYNPPLQGTGSYIVK